MTINHLEKGSFFSIDIHLSKEALSLLDPFLEHSEMTSIRFICSADNEAVSSERQMKELD